MRGPIQSGRTSCLMDIPVTSAPPPTSARQLNPDSHLRFAATGLDALNMSIVLCGPEAMRKALTKGFAARRESIRRIRYEMFEILPSFGLTVLAAHLADGLKARRRAPATDSSRPVHARFASTSATARLDEAMVQSGGRAGRCGGGAALAVCTVTPGQERLVLAAFQSGLKLAAIAREFRLSRDQVESVIAAAKPGRR